MTEQQKMDTSIVFQPIALSTSSRDTDGRLMLIDGRLAAVLVRLQDEIHSQDLQGRWFVEAAFDQLSGLSGCAIFATLGEAADRLCGRSSEKQAQSG